jgi:hypothetical protein
MSWKGTDLLVTLGCLLLLATLQPNRTRRAFCPRFWCLGRLVRRNGLVRCSRCDYSRPELPIDKPSPRGPR